MIKQRIKDLEEIVDVVSAGSTILTPWKSVMRPEVVAACWVRAKEICGPDAIEVYEGGGEGNDGRVCVRWFCGLEERLEVFGVNS